jgi:PAS domain S-box-containing protein
MEFVNTIDPMVLVNLLLSTGIVLISWWGYRKIGNTTPLYFGLAFSLFALSHFLIFIGLENAFSSMLVLLRTSGYILAGVGLFAIIRDIIRRRVVEQALRETEERRRATFGQASVGIAEVSTDDRIVRINRRFCEILGYSEIGILVQAFWNLMYRDDRLKHIESLNHVIRGELFSYTGEMRLIKNDGSLVWCQLFISSVQDSCGKPKYFIVVLEDISARRQVEEELAQLNAMLEQRIKDRTGQLVLTNEILRTEIAHREEVEEHLRASLQEKEVLIREVHHRVKNNLQIIISLLFLQSKKSSDTGLQDAFIDCQTRVKSMALVHEKLYRSADLSSIDLGGYLNNLVSNLMVSYGIDTHRIKTTIDVSTAPLTVNTAIPLGLIMNELVSNVLKYAFPDGRTGELTITSWQDDRALKISVRDNGCGIPADFDWKHPQTLGLHLVIMLTRQLKGTVDLSRDNGTTFTLIVPMNK